MTWVWRLVAWLCADGDARHVSAFWVRDHDRRACYGGVERHTGSIVLPLNKLRDSAGGWNARRLKRKAS